MSRVIVIGGGAAGMMAAYRAGQKGHEVILLERNEKLGKKLFLTGKGRCNISNSAPIEDFFFQIPRNSKFLYSAFAAWSNEDMISFLNQQGLKTKLERGGRVFPQSDKSSDVINALASALRSVSVQIRFHARVKSLLIEEEMIQGVLLEGGESVKADAVVLATGGLSYPQTGSSGDGYNFARACGHDIKDMQASLVPLVIEEKWPTLLQGLSLRNVKLTAIEGKREVYNEQGEMLFTHFGISGPLVLSCSSHLNMAKKPRILLDLKPALNIEKLDARIRREIEANGKRHYINMLGSLLPAKMLPVFAELSGIDEHKRSSEITKAEREKIVQLLKALPMTVKSFRPIEEAIITRGGVSVKQVDASSMQSKLIKGLYFAGELLDLDAYTGGYNLQIAWSTGYLAGNSIE